MTKSLKQRMRIGRPGPEGKGAFSANRRRLLAGAALAAGLGPEVLARATAPAVLGGQGEMRFDVHYGSQDFKVGEARHQWLIERERYELELELEASGLAGLFGLHYEQRSSGRVIAGSLRPQRFIVAQRGREPERAEFDWEAGEVALYRGERLRRSAALAPGDQDVLSLWHEARRHAALADEFRLGVVTGKRAKQAVLKVEGEENLRVPAGEFDTVRMRAHAEEGGLEIELWLSPAHRLLPVRIRLTNEKGEVLDQRATAIDFHQQSASAPAGAGIAGRSTSAASAVAAGSLQWMR